jgi:hypothetical protein
MMEQNTKMAFVLSSAMSSTAPNVMSAERNAFYVTLDMYDTFNLIVELNQWSLCELMPLTILPIMPP